MAVYTQVSFEDLEQFLARYDVGAPRSFKGIAEGVENSNYLLETESGRFILTLYEKRVDANDLPFFLGLMDHLAARGVACPTPIKARDGAALHELNTRPAALISFLNGVAVTHAQAHHCGAVGDAMAKLHDAGQDFKLTRKNALSVYGWKTLVEACLPRAAEVDAALPDLLKSEMAYFENAWPSGLPISVIHADLFPDNVFFTDGKFAGIIDFYFACTDFLAYDVAVCLNAWCFDEEDTYRPDLGRILIESYQSVRAFTPAEIEAFPVLARGAAFRFLLTRLYDWLNHVEGALVRPKDPKEYLRKLSFHQKAATFNDYLGPNA